MLYISGHVSDESTCSEKRLRTKFTIFHSPYKDRGWNDVKSMCKFSPCIFDELWIILTNQASDHENDIKGWGTNLTGKGSILIVMGTLKHG